jgi:preprotein translocase subunit SecD
MKRYSSKLALCVVPVALAAGVVGWAYSQYEKGYGGFRLGVDLAGGTVLVYEVDETKVSDKFKPEDLAAALKRRIDPADLYNIAIRPVGGTPRRGNLMRGASGRSSPRSRQPPAAPWRRGSGCWRSTRPTATCCTSSSRP